MINVRTATVLDAARIAYIHVATWRAAYAGQMPDDFLAGLDENKRAEFWRERLAESRGNVLVGEFDGEMIGFCDWVSSRDADADRRSVAEIAAIYVLAEHWGQGAGGALCRRSLRIARSLDFTVMTLWVLETNSRARQFYESMGFHCDGARKTEKLTANFEITEVRYRLELPVGGIPG